MLIQVRVATPDPGLRDRLLRILSEQEIVAAGASSEDELWESLAADSVDLVVLDPRFTGRSMKDAVAAVRALPDRPEVVGIQSGRGPDERARLIGAGCLAVLEPGSDAEALRDQVTTLLHRLTIEADHRLRMEQAEDGYRLGDFVSSSPAMRRLISVARRVAASDSSVLILGETGVGKEWLGRAIHEESDRSSGPFLAVNLGAIPETLVESELFGHEKGAFTDAARAHRGCFELSHGGTLFLDEVADLPTHLQVKLLRALQDRRIRRVGGERDIPVDVRIMAATNKDLDEEMQAERFRQDLYYRLGVVTLTIPPLRDRTEDLSALTESSLDHFRVQLRRPVRGIDAEAMRLLTRYSWPGNVRELMNTIERAVLLCRQAYIGVVDLPDTVRGLKPPLGDAPPAPSQADTESVWLDMPLHDLRDRHVADLERRYLEAWLARTGGGVGATARRAGITPRTLYQKMKQYGLRKEDYRF